MIAELLLYQAQQNNDLASNGGRLTSTTIADNVKNNLWPDVPEAERTAGSNKYRKFFIKVDDPENLAYQNTRVFVETHSPGDDSVTIFAGTQRNTQGDLSSPRLYGAGDLDANVSAMDPTIDVLTEGSALGIFQDGDTIRISDKATVSGPGNEEFLTLAATGAVSYLGNVATLTLAAGQEPQNAYSTTNTRVASVIEHGNVDTSIDNVTVTSAAGTFDDTQVTQEHRSTVEETWTVTFTSSTEFSVSGDTLGSIGTGNVSTTFAPNNPDFSLPYMSIPAAAWGGTFIISDTVSFQTHPAAIPVWQNRDVPVGATSLAGNQVKVAVAGQSA